MKNGYRRSLVAWVLAAAVMLALPAYESLSLAVEVNQKGNCSLSVNPGTFEGLKDADVVIDLYKVADAQSVSGYDTYEFQVTEAYAGLNKSTSDFLSMSNEGWKSLAQEAAKLTLEGDKKIEKAVSGAKVSSRIGSLDSGLYLLIARGSGLKDYVTERTDENGKKSIATVARSDQYEYTFLPELVSLPGKAADADGNINTANPGGWLYDMTVTLKPEETLRMGSLEIVKTLETYENSSPATFVFQIEATWKGEKVYSDVAALTFSEAGQKHILIENKIPVGASVTVTEVYSGSKYTLTTDKEVETVIPVPEDGNASVSFTNTYDEENKNGYGIVNHFEKKNGYWADPDNTRDNAAE